MSDQSMEERLIDKMELKNGLTLECYDHSRPVAGDRWLVSFEARIDVPVNAECLESPDSENPSFDAIRKAVGERVTYSYEKSRHFIEETEKDKVFKGLKERFLETTLTYFSSAEFPRNIILSRYQEVQGISKPWSRQ
ncbi:MAG: hypothetical protein ABUK19_02445 [Desulfobacteria bacterium]